MKNVSWMSGLLDDVMRLRDLTVRAWPVLGFVMGGDSWSYLPTRTGIGVQTSDAYHPIPHERGAFKEDAP